MKSLFVACFVFVSSVVTAQDKSCTLWVGEISESTAKIQQLVEKQLEMQTKLQPAETPTIQEFKDANDLVQIKVWLKPKKTLVNGAMATVYTISSYKIVTLTDKLDELYKTLVEKVQPCTTETTALNTVFASTKMYIERHSGGFGKKGLPMSTLTIMPK